MNQDICDSDRVTDFLNGNLSDLEIAGFTQHLEQCRDCRTELETQAASADRWREMKDCLSRRPDPEPTLEFNSGSSPLPFTIRQVVNMLHPTDDPGALGRLGGFEVVGVVGHGSMGVVLKAVDRALDRIVALKVMNPTLAECATARYRFGREAKAAAAVLHPNVIPIHAVSTKHDLPYLVMPYIAGTSLQQRMDQQGPLEVVEVLRIGSQVAAGLAAAHEKGLIHRDIKPANVMLDEGVETAVITDFGLAQTIDDATMTKTGAIAGTPEYMSPEQARGESVDCASDVFSLASLIYALCTGSRPFRAKTSFGVLRKITDEEPKPIRERNAQVPTWLCRLIEQMHAKSSDERPSSREVRDQLVAFLAHVYQPDRIPLPTPSAKSLSPTTRPISRVVILGVSTMTVMILAACIFAMQLGLGLDTGVIEDANKPSGEQRMRKDATPVFRSLNLAFPNPKQRGKLVIDITRGSIDVVGYDGSDVVIEILTPPKFARTEREGAETDSELVPVFAPKYDLTTDAEGNSITLDTYNQDYVLNLRIRVPFKTDLTLDTYRDGYVAVESVSGTIHAHSEQSDIRLSGIDGSATAFSQNGDLTISFNQVAADALLDFESNYGSIDLTLPASTRVTTAVYAGRGSYRTAFSKEFVPVSGQELQLPDDIPDLDKYEFGKINGGGVPLRIENRNGSIMIRKLSKNSRDMPLKLSR